jgi:hypothetical protein
VDQFISKYEKILGGDKQKKSSTIKPQKTSALMFNKLKDIEAS